MTVINKNVPFFQIREKSLYGSPWRQTPRSRISPDTEVGNIMGTPSRIARPRTPSGRRSYDMASPCMCRLLFKILCDYF